jgi:hypothetical protein
MMLIEPDSSIDTEVELVRRRTRLRRGDTDPTALTGLAHRPSRSVARENRRTASQHAQSHLRRSSLALGTSSDGPSRGEVLEIPYDNTQPRSHDTLHRAQSLHRRLVPKDMASNKQRKKIARLATGSA